MNRGRHAGWSNNGWPEEMRQAFDRFLQPEDSDASYLATSQWASRIDIREGDKRFMILAHIPVVDPA